MEVRIQRKFLTQFRLDMRKCCRVGIDLSGDDRHSSMICPYAFVVVEQEIQTDLNNLNGQDGF